MPRQATDIRCPNPVVLPDPDTSVCSSRRGVIVPRIVRGIFANHQEHIVGTLLNRNIGYLACLTLEVICKHRITTRLINANVINNKGG